MLPIFNFVINCTDTELQTYGQLDVEKDAAVFCRWDLEWGLQTYLHLKSRNKIPVQLSNKLAKNAINIVHSAQLMFDGGTPEDFIVCIRADFPKRDWAHFHIVQNLLQLGPDTAPTLLWVQPGLIPRDENRNSVQRVAYAGQTYNGNLAGTEHTWQSLFAEKGIEFTTLPAGDCFDLHDIDVLIGIRSFDKNPHQTKPPSKMINAWHARIPFVGGYDSAFSQYGVPEEDYLRVQSAEETLEAVLRLKIDPQLYAKLVANGAKKAVGMTNEAIAAAWEKTLTGPVMERYKRWQSNLPYEKSRFKALKRYSVLKHNARQVIKAVVGAGTVKKLQGKLLGR